MSEQKRTRLLVPLALLSLVALAGCGGGGSTAAASGNAGSSAGTTAAGGSTNGASTNGASTNSVPAEMQPYIACLKKNGVDLPNGGFFGGRNRNGQGGQNAQGEGSAPPSLQLGGAPQTQAQGQSGGNGAPASPPPSFDRSKFQAAQQACASLLPEGATFGPFGGGQGGGANASAFNAYRSCMSDHGVTLPSRQNGQSASSSSPPVSIDRNSDAFKAANTVCAPLLPNGGQGFGGQGGPNGQSGANGQGNGGQTGQGGTTQGTNP